jgi:hypothetical protein
LLSGSEIELKFSAMEKIAVDNADRSQMQERVVAYSHKRRTPNPKLLVL